MRTEAEVNQKILELIRSAKDDLMRYSETTDTNPDVALRQVEAVSKLRVYHWFLNRVPPVFPCQKMPEKGKGVLKVHVRTSRFERARNK
jgi:hypothetical protein